MDNKVNALMPIRKEVLGKIEVLRSEKLVGTASEAGIEVILMGNKNQHGYVFDPPLLREMCNISECLMTWVESDKDSLTWEIRVWPLKDDKDYVQCTRCRLFHTELENYDSLCNRCCRVLMQLPDNESIHDKLRSNCRQQNYNKALALRANPKEWGLTVEPEWVTRLLGENAKHLEEWESEGGKV
jgi:hypothetical protein